MPGIKDIPKYERGDPLHAKTINTLTDEVRKLNRVRTGGGLSARMGPGGLDLGVTFPTAIRVAKTGGTAIAAMSGSTPGSGAITLYEFNGTTLVAGESETGYNLHPTATVAADAWVMIADVDGYPFIFWEPCS